MRLDKELGGQTTNERPHTKGFKPNKAPNSTNGLQKSECNKQNDPQPSGQKKLGSKNKTHQSAVMKYGDLTIAASSPDILKTIRPLP